MLKRQKLDVEASLQNLKTTNFEKRKILKENLDLDYFKLFSNNLASEIFAQLEDSITYLSGDLTRVKVFGKMHEIPRQQAAYGDEGLIYRFSGTSVPAKKWTPLLLLLKIFINTVTGFDFNFVLLNRYRNGNDHIGEHRDNEVDLDKSAPIASLSLGQERTFVLRHQDLRKRGSDKRDVPKVEINLEHGSLLLMNPPTNDFWYHSLPQRKKAHGIRLNLTFRKIKTRCKV